LVRSSQPVGLGVALNPKAIAKSQAQIQYHSLVAKPVYKVFALR
jgi:hypothetical protein